MFSTAAAAVQQLQYSRNIVLLCGRFPRPAPSGFFFTLSALPQPRSGTLPPPPPRSLSFSVQLRYRYVRAPGVKGLRERERGKKRVTRSAHRQYPGHQVSRTERNRSAEGNTHSGRGFHSPSPTRRRENCESSRSPFGRAARERCH